MRKLSIIIPVYNEAKTIAAVIKVVNDLTLVGQVEKEIIIVNDCSTDLSGKHWLSQRMTGTGGAI